MIRINLSKLGISFDARFFEKIHFGFYARQFLFGVAETLGVRNNTHDGKRLVFLDYDNILLHEMLIPELKFLQDKYELGDLYIMRSSQKPNSYHVVGFDKLKVFEWKDLMEDSSCDENYKKPALKDFKTAVLRIAPKGSSNAPTYLMTVRSVFKHREKSLAHANFFRAHYGFKTRDLINVDESDEVIFVKYATLNYSKKVIV